MSRRDVLTDAGLRVLADHGARALTHRAVDREAGLPAGSCSNVFRNRAALLEGLAARIYERLTPSPELLDAEASRPADRDQWVRLMVDLVDRARAQPELHLALLALRLEATHQPEVLAPLSRLVSEQFAADVAFHARSRLAGGPDEIRLLHFAIGGLITHLLTLPDALGALDVEATIAALVDRIVFGAPGG